MKLGKEFVAGAMVGIVAGVAGAIKVMWNSGQWHDIRLWAVNKLVWKICGKDYYLRDRRFDGMDITHNEGADYKVWPKENPSHDSCATCEPYESDEKTFAVMDICGTEGLYSDKRGKLEKELLNECTSYDSGIYDYDGKERVTADHFRIGEKDYYLYYLRGGKDDDPGAICTVEKGPVKVNYCGVFVTDKKLDILEEKSYCELGDDDWDFTGEWMSVKCFLSDEQWRQR